MTRILALIPLVLVFILTLAIGSQNGQLVQFNYLIAQGEFSLSMLLGLFFGGGFLLGWLVFGLLFLRLKIQNRTLNRTMRRQSRELELARSTVKE
ncbi:LapA family protein [Aeromonas salmonicida]